MLSFPTGFKESEKPEVDEKTISVSYSTETSSSWIREANVEPLLRSYTKHVLAGRNEYFFRIWHLAESMFKWAPVFFLMWYWKVQSLGFIFYLFYFLRILVTFQRIRCWASPATYQILRLKINKSFSGLVIIYVKLTYLICVF